MNKIITNKEMNYIRVERNDIVFQQDKIYPDIIDAVEKLQQENQQLKDNWNKLREYIINTRYSWGDEEQDNEDYDLTIEDILNKILELEKGGKNNE